VTPTTNTCFARDFFIGEVAKSFFPDAEKARQLFEEAGWQSGRSLKLATANAKIWRE